MDIASVSCRKWPWHLSLLRYCASHSFPHFLLAQAPILFLHLQPGWTEVKALLEEPNWESFPSYAELPTHLGVDGWALPRDPEHTQRLEWWGMGGPHLHAFWGWSPVILDEFFCEGSGHFTTCLHSCDHTAVPVSCMETTQSIRVEIIICSHGGGHAHMDTHTCLESLEDAED